MLKIELEPDSGHFERKHLLSPRQAEVLNLIAGGFSVNEIAWLYGISGRTIETHKREIYSRLRAVNGLNAALIGVDEGIVDTDEIISDFDIKNARSLTSVDHRLLQLMLKNLGAQSDSESLAKEMQISKGVVEYRLGRICKKLEARNKINAGVTYGIASSKKLILTS